MPKKDKDRECTCTEKRGKLFTCDYCKDEEVQDYDDLFEDDDPQKDKEKRKDTDGKMYTRKQFIKMYKGRESGLRAWTAAKPAEADKTSSSLAMPDPRPARVTGFHLDVSRSITW